MSDQRDPAKSLGEHAVYQIRLQGHLSGQWADWFGGMDVTLTNDGDTLLIGPVPDQAALHGLLRKVRDLGLPLLAVHRIGVGSPATRQDACE